MNDLKKVIYNCRKATYLIDKKLVDGITFRESVELRIHLFGCNVCRIYMAQSKKINHMIGQMVKGGNKPEIKLDNDFKEALQVQIQDHLNKN